jgi:hypothetical protein
MMKIWVKEDRQTLVMLAFGFLSFWVLMGMANTEAGLAAIIPVSRTWLLAMLGFLSLSLGIFNWRLNVKLVLYLVILEGAFRKWVLPEESSILYFLKDFFLVAAYLGYLLDARRDKTRLDLWSWRFFLYIALIFFVYCVLELLNPRLTHPGIGFLGFKAYFLYVPLVYLMKDVFKSEDDFTRFFRKFIAFAVPVCFLGAIQFFNPVTHPLNRYVWGEKEIAAFGSTLMPRITGTFSYISGLNSYLTIIFCLVIGFLMSKRNSVFASFLNYLVLVCCCGSVLMTGSRTPVIEIAVVFLFFIFFFGINILQFIRRYLIQFILIGLLVSVATIKFFPVALKAFEYRVARAGIEEPKSRIKDLVRFPVQEMELAGLVGHGIGYTQQGTTQLLEHFNIDATEHEIGIYYEEEPERVMLELGFIGFALFYLFKLAVCLLCFQIFANVTNTELKPFTLGLSGFVTVNFLMPIVFNHVTNVFFWMSAGMVLMFYRFNNSAEAPI